LTDFWAWFKNASLWVTVDGESWLPDCLVHFV
jgi:hypothetical protein